MRPLFSFVAFIPRGEDARAARTAGRLARRLADWSLALDHKLARVWLRAAPQSAFGHRPLAEAGCRLGLDVDQTAQTIDELRTRSWGAYVAIAVDVARGAVEVFRDPTGRIECWRVELPGCDVLFTHLAEIHDLVGHSLELNWGYLTHHLNQDYLHGEQTGLSGITELLPGEQIVYTGGAATKRLLWRPEAIAAEPHVSLAQAQSALRTAAEASVSAWTPCYRRMLFDLSGGLDSSITLGLLRGCSNRPDIVAVNRVTPGREGDERDYARETARFNGVELFEQLPESIDVDFSTTFSRRVMRPRARVLPLGYDEAGLEAAGRFKADAFFTGTGGDHLFYNSLPISAACDYRRHGGTLIGYPAVAVALAQVAGDTVWGVAAEGLRRRFGPRESLQTVASAPNRFLTELARSGLDEARYAHPSALAAIAAAPPAKRRQIVFMLELQRHYYRYGRADACEEVHPLVSQPLMEASLRTPAHWFAVGGVQRGLARRAFADLLPPMILNRRTKGGNGVYWTQFMTRRLPKLRELLLDGRLAARGLLDRRELEATLTPLGLAASKDFMALSTCLSTELWVRQAEADLADTAQLARQEMRV